jgi:hypothetical protein
MNQEFDQAMDEIRNVAVDDAVVEAAAARVWTRLSAAAGEAGQAHIQDCSAFQSLIPELRAGKLDAARATLLRDHLHECVACRKIAQGTAPAPLVMPRRSAQPARRLPYRFAAAAAIVAAAGISVWIALDRSGNPSGRAIVQTVNGSLFAVSAEGIQPLAAGAALPDNAEIRTAKDSTAMVELRDGSMVEARERSAFTTGGGPRDVTVRLNRGSIIVQAAHRSSGHLFVATADCRVAVTGTIFSVSAGAKGSRVSVVQGEVHVDQANQQKVLHPGGQAVTSADLVPQPVRDDFAWSRDHARYEAMLASLGQALSQIRQPELRYESRLLGRLPADVMFYAGIPNLTQYLGEAENVFRDKMAQSPELQAWWREQGGRTAAFIEKMRAASEYLGDEIAVIGVAKGDGPAFLAELKRPGFGEFLKQMGAPQEQAAPAEIERNGMALFGAPRAVAQLAGVLDTANGAIQSTSFYKRIEEAYHRGAGFLVCANMEQFVHPADTPHGLPPVSNAQALIFNEAQVDGVMQTRVTLDFNGARTGVASWLAPPAPMGSLDYVSSDSSAAAAAVVADGGAIADQLKPVAPAELGAVREALRSTLGGEFALAIDGPILPVPSWKLIAEVYDPVAAQAALIQAAASYTNAPENAGHKALAVSQETFEGRTYYTIAVPNGGPLLEFHYTFADGYLIAGPSRGIVARALQIKETGSSLLRASKVAAMMPRDHYANFSLVFYQNIAPAVAPIAGLLGGMAPKTPDGRGGRGPMDALTQLKSSLVAAYAEPERITFAANGDLLGPALANLMRGDVAGAATSAIPFLQPQGTRKHEMAYR